jgi:shikimate dehydrogenase
MGYNTDWSGFLADVLAHGVVIKGQDCLVLGAGGSARAVAYGLAASGGRVHIFSRRIEQARQLVADLSPHVSDGLLLAYHWPALAEVCEVTAVSLIVNTTPLGMFPNTDTTAWPQGLAFPSTAFVYDLVYNPAETALVRQAREAGLEAVSGLGMLLNQGVQAFELWTGQKPDREIMAATLNLPKK